MASICGNFLRFVQSSLDAFSYLSCIGQLKNVNFLSNYRKMILLQIQVSWALCNVLCIIYLFYDLFLLYKFLLLNSCINYLCVIAITCVTLCRRMWCFSFFMTYHFMHEQDIILIHAFIHAFWWLNRRRTSPLSPPSPLSPSPVSSLWLSPKLTKASS